MTKKTCYMCENMSTGLEHVPPKCLFPEIKDLSVNYRKNLIKVPSCDVHNQAKSKDDTHLMETLVFHSTNNPVAEGQIKTKILRAWARDPKLRQSLLRDQRPILANGEPTLAFKVDFIRLKRSMDCIARGLYYHQYKKKWSAKLGIESPAWIFLNSKDVILSNIGAGVSQVLVDFPKLGENPDVFWYQVLHNKPDELLINMMFYGGLQVLAYSEPDMP